MTALKVRALYKSCCLAQPSFKNLARVTFFYWVVSKAGYVIRSSSRVDLGGT